MPTDNTGEWVDRRRLLQATAAASAAGLAGCQGGDGGGDTTGQPTDTQTRTQTTGMQTTETSRTGTETATPTEGPPPHVSGQSLTWYTMQNPQDMTWLMGGWLDPIAPQGRFTNSHAPYELSNEEGVLGPWYQGASLDPDPIYQYYESIEDSPEAYTFKIRDDATWSNGDDLTPADILLSYMEFRMTPGMVPPSHEFTDTPPGVYAATTDYEIVDDNVFRLLSDGGHFDEFPVVEMWTQIVVNHAANTNVAPYDQMWSLVSDWWEMAKNGEIDPFATGGSDWDIYVEFPTEIFGPHGWSENEEQNNYDFHWEKRFQNPDNVHTIGAWTLGSINGTQGVTLVPNEEHYAADQVNFDEIEVQARPSQRANRAALKAGNQDYYTGTVPQYIAQSFPDTVSQRKARANGGLGLTMDLKVEPFARRKARQAILYAIDNERVSKAVHRTKFVPVSVPGGNVWNRDQILGQEWIDANLQTFETDREKAAQAMSEAGFTREGGTWVDGEGNALSITLPTANPTPQFEPAVANQLTQFGIETSLQTYSGSVYTEKLRNGELDIQPRDWGTGYYQNALAVPWVLLTLFRNVGRVQTRAFPEEQYEQYWSSDKPQDEAAPVFTLEAPPVGEPDGELQTYHPATIGLQVNAPKSVEHLREWGRKAAWLLNWHLPVLPLANGQLQQFLDTAHWSWPGPDSKTWENVGYRGYTAEKIVAPGRYVHANPDNPEEGASVQD